MKSKITLCLSLVALPLAAEEPDLFSPIEPPGHTASCACVSCCSSGLGTQSSGWEPGSPLLSFDTGDVSGGGSINPPSPSSSLGSFDLVINAGPTLAANAPALAAFERAAMTWESWIADPITVTIDADLQDLMNPSVIGQANSVSFSFAYDVARDAMAADAADEADDAIVSALPTFAQASFSLPTGITHAGGVQLNKATVKALGGTGFDEEYGATDATITFNTQFAFDFDSSDGIGAGLTDFETTALHEIGHALGFTSTVDLVDFAVDGGLTGTVNPTGLDLFRFENGTANDPETLAEFTTAERSLDPNVDAIFDDLDGEARLSTGVETGDGRQASHWKDNNLTGVLIGTMDPTLAPEQVFVLSTLDLRALDLIGYEIAIPEPSTVWFTLCGLLVWRRRR